MSNVSYLKEVKKSNSNSDFHLQDVSFDIEKLQDACDEVLNMKGFDTSLGIPHFAGISLNQIPGDPDSIKGSKVRGVYWTKPDSTGKEVSRDVAIEEEKYTEFVKDFEFYNKLKANWQYKDEKGLWVFYTDLEMI